MMDKNSVLKVVNPALAILMLNQPFSALLSVLTDWDFFEGLHIGGGVLLVLVAAVHFMLNWRWGVTNILKKSKTQKG
jgi:hypothetical protein